MREPVGKGEESPDGGEITTKALFSCPGHPLSRPSYQLKLSLELHVFRAAGGSQAWVTKLGLSHQLRSVCRAAAFRKR